MTRVSQRLSKLLGVGKRREKRDWQRSYSQEGEDMVLRRFFNDAHQRKGFYIDIGAHHPTRFSNTKLFYDLGWRGVSIDPRPGFAKEFLDVRPSDIAIEAAIAQNQGEMTYYMFDEPALNGFDAKLSTERDAISRYKIIGHRPVPMERLDTLLSITLAEGQRIDFMSIDVEGLDLEVVMSNDWERFRPRFVLVEIFGKWLSDILSSESAAYLLKQDYSAVSRTRHTVFFEDRRFQAALQAA